MKDPGLVINQSCCTSLIDKSPTGTLMFVKHFFFNWNVLFINLSNLNDQLNNACIISTTLINWIALLLWLCPKYLVLNVFIEGHIIMEHS